jgi:hypothetical protein
MPGQKLKIMQNFYKHFPEIDNVYWTNYFLNEFIPEYKFVEQISNTGSAYTLYSKKDFSNNLEILKLSSLLTDKLKFPPIDYFSIFRHVIHQPIHADGIAVLRNASFNLPLAGFEGTKMCFYKTKTDILPKAKDAYYFKEDEVYPVGEFLGSNEWVLVNSAVPHNVVNVDYDNPRLTLCVRFVNNPKFEDLITNAES